MGCDLSRPPPIAGRTIVHAVHDTLYASVTGGGLHRWDGHAWQPFAATTALARATVTGLAALPGGRLLAFASPAALLVVSVDGTTATPWTGPGADALLALRPLGLLTVPDGRVAAFTRSSRHRRHHRHAALARQLPTHPCYRKRGRLRHRHIRSPSGQP